MSTLFSVDIEEGTRLKGYLAIDSSINGRSYGGVRMASDLSSHSLVQVARVMTLKHGFLGLPLGGAKAGIVADPEMPSAEKQETLKRFGQALKPLLQTETYIPGGDLGVTDKDIRFMLSANGLQAPPRRITFQTSGFYAGITVFIAAVKAANQVGLDLNSASVAIEGFGGVGSSVALALWKKGIRVVAISTSQGAIYSENGLDIGELIELYNQVGSQVTKLFGKAESIDKGRLPEVEVDIFSPCAQSYSITSENAHRVSAKIICPGANVPMTAEGEQVLLQKGILIVPDFVANCGGVLASTMKRTGLRDEFITHFMEHKFGQRVTDIIESAQRERVSLGVYAERIAEEKFLRVKKAAEGRQFANKAFNLALQLYRKGVIPYQFSIPIAPRYFEKRLGQS